jgi:hypothetical protein
VTRCWNGKDLDSPDHQSHVAYGQGSGANGGGACPSTHPVKLPQVMYEVMWDVNKFADKSLWPTDGSDPFVYSMNIGGSAAHGDYVFGWEGDSLQKAMDNNCNLNTACPKAGLTVQQPAQYNACKKKQQAPEDVDGCKFYSCADSKRHLLMYDLQGSRQCLWATRLSRHKRLLISLDCPSCSTPYSWWKSLSVVCCHSLLSICNQDSDPSIIYAHLVRD